MTDQLFSPKPQTFEQWWSSLKMGCSGTGILDQLQTTTTCCGLDIDADTLKYELPLHFYDVLHKSYIGKATKSKVQNSLLLFNPSKGYINGKAKYDEHMNHTRDTIRLRCYLTMMRFFSLFCALVNETVDNAYIEKTKNDTEKCLKILTDPIEKITLQELFDCDCHCIYITKNEQSFLRLAEYRKERKSQMTRKMPVAIFGIDPTQVDYFGYVDHINVFDQK